jgi:glycosyltransferase involved in cell wall biosynthesis
LVCCRAQELKEPDIIGPRFPSISVIILTFNEEANLPGAIDSVKGWAKQIFVVDSYSTDKTVDLALSFEGVQVVQHRFENYSAQWNWALTHLPISGQWTLKLDADERVTPAFKLEIGQLLSKDSSEVSGIYFRRQIVFLGHRLRWGGTLENYDLRCWRTGSATFENRPVNEHAVVDGKTWKIKALVDHHTSKSLSDWLEKHNRYASLEAQCLIQRNVTGDIRPRLAGTPDQRRMWLRKLYYRVPLRHFLYFCYRYFFRMGLLDGNAGFCFAFLHAAFFYWIDLKVAEYHRTGLLPEVLWPGRGKPHPLVVASELQKQMEGMSSAPSTTV